MDYTGESGASGPVDSLGGRGDQPNTVTFRVGPREDEANHVERGRQTVTVRATGIWTLTFTFVRDLPTPSS